MNQKEIIIIVIIIVIIIIMYILIDKRGFICCVCIVYNIVSYLSTSTFSNSHCGVECICQFIDVIENE